MKNDSLEGMIKPSRKGYQREASKSMPKPHPMASMTSIVNQLMMLAIALLCFMTFINGFLCPGMAIHPRVRQKFNAKSTLFPSNLRDRSRDRTYIDIKSETDCSFQSHKELESPILNREPKDKEYDYSKDTRRKTTLLDRRTVARTLVAIGFGGGMTNGLFMETPSSQAATMLPVVSTEAINGNQLPTSEEAIPQEALPSDDVVDLPLEFIPTLGAYVVRYFLFNEAFAAIVDTGSPFLTVPCYCKPYRNRKMFWGCYKPELTRDSGYGNTIEGFDNNYGAYFMSSEFLCMSLRISCADIISLLTPLHPNAKGPVVWRKAEFSFFPSSSESDERSRTTPSDASSTDVIFGVLGQDLLNGSGGVFFGLIKETDRWIRPSFLGQTGYRSFCVDLRRNNDTSTAEGVNESDNERANKNARLLLSKQSMIETGKWRRIGETIADTEDWIPLVRDLKKKYGAPVVHYTAKASGFVVNGLPLLINKRKPLYVIFDTGVSGMVVSQELFDGRYLQARKNREKSLWGKVEVSFETNTGKTITLSATKPIATPLGKANPWKGFKGNLIAVGLAFLEGFATTVDIDDGKVLFVKG